MPGDCLSILVTAFGPFGEHASNVTQELVDLLPTTLSLQLRDCNDLTTVTVDSRVLSVDEAGSVVVRNELLSGKRWDAILHLGLAGKIQCPQLELLARDVLDMRIPDNTGRQILGATLSGHGDLPSTVESLATWDMASLPCRAVLSNNAGAFICNETYHRTLEAITQIASVGSNVATPATSPRHASFVTSPHLTI
jgi:pyrrolidone-carboxylate peptidase